MEKAARLVAGGGVIVYPAETVYGLGGDARRPDVAARIHQIKGSDPAKPLLALTDTWERVAAWIDASDSIRRLWAAEMGAVTWVLSATSTAPAALVSAEGSVGLRRTTSAWARQVIARSGVPLFSTSANPTGEPPPVRFADVAPSIRRAVDLAVEDDATTGGTPSTVARIDGDRVTILRPGPVSAEAIQAAIAGRA